MLKVWAPEQVSPWCSGTNDTIHHSIALGRKVVRPKWSWVVFIVVTPAPGKYCTTSCASSQSDLRIFFYFILNRTDSWWILTPINLSVHKYLLVCNNYFSIFGASSEVMNNSVVFLQDWWALLNDTLGLRVKRRRERQKASRRQTAYYCLFIAANRKNSF